MIQIKFNDSGIDNTVGTYSPDQVPYGCMVYSDYLDSILVPSEDKSMWIGFGISDNTIDVIDDNAPVEGVLLKNVEVRFTL